MKEQNIINSLVDLTRQRDQRLIRSKLLSSLIEITDAAWLVLCRMYHENDSYRLEIIDRIPNPSSDKAIQHFPRELFDDIQLFIRTRETGTPSWVQVSETCEAIVFNIPGEKRFEDFAVMFDHNVNGRSERMVTSILDLYDNFLTLVIENTQDPLTRLYNRGAFDIDLPGILLEMNKKPERRKVPRPGQKRNFLAMFDLDHFKRINDSYGHLYGDEVILIFSSLLSETLGERDKIYRYGGEEFAAIVDHVSVEEMQKLMDEVRQTVEQYDFPQVGRVTVSVGVAELKDNSLPSTLLDCADQALYYSKEMGRNRVTYYDDIHTTESEPASASEDVFF